MKRNETILSMLVAAVLALPYVAFASDVPGSSDEARVAVQRVQNQSTPAAHYEAGALSRASSTDEARALAGRQQVESTRIAVPSDCIHAGIGTTGSTDEARAALGRQLEECAQHA